MSKFIDWLLRLLRLQTTTELELSALCDKLGKSVGKNKVEYVVVMPPRQDDLASYYATISSFVRNQWMLSFMDTLKRNIMAEVEYGTKSIDFYRGKLSLLSDIMAESDKAAMMIDQMNGGK